MNSPFPPFKASIFRLRIGEQHINLLIFVFVCSLFQVMSTQESEAGPWVFGGDENEEVEEEEEEYESDGSEPSEKCHKASDIWEGFWILKRHENFQCSTCKANSGKSGASLLITLHSNVNRTGPDFNAARRAMVMFTISSGESLSLVEKYYFQQLFRFLNPTFPMCRAILDRDDMNLYEQENDTLQHIIAEASGGLSFSVDHWE